MIRQRRTDMTAALLCCAAVGALAFFLTYGFRVLDPTNDGWILSSYIETDITQRYAGWIAYRQAESFFPLTASELISFPYGDRASLTDGMPLFMVLFKLFDPILPETFQFCGILCLMNLMLQGVTGGMLTALYTNSRINVVLGGAVFCLSPIFLERIFRHTSLSFHWLILLAIWLYIKLHRGGSRRLLWAFVGICTASVWLHLYFTPMVIGFFVSAVVDCRLTGKGSIWHEVSLAAAVFLCIFSAWVLGLLGLGMDNTVGYGTMGLNLNALFNPVSLGPDWWVPGKGRIDWSAFLPMRALAENNIESFNYLGCGILLGLACTAAAAVVGLLRKKKNMGTRAAFGILFRFIYRHLFLCVFLAFSTAFAISNTVCAFSYVLFSFPLPDKIQALFSAFRASGRLFWSVNYVLVLAVIAAIHRFTGDKKRLACILLASVLLIQVIDLFPVLRYKYSYTQEIQTKWSDAREAEVLELIGDDTLLYNLELRDDRAMCAVLLKQGIANNFWLINRGGYMVEELQQDIDMTVQALLRGEKPYDDCVYATRDGKLAEDILQASPQLEYRQIADIWYLYEHRAE